jgi:cobyrinic acid a,c-diamide synthase
VNTPTLVIAAPGSGAGKTTVTLALLRALRRHGYGVGSFKVGPDYIDPAFHARATGRPCLNLDSWAMRFETLALLMQEAGQAADIVIGEGVMGLFDGAPGGSGSTADLAALFGLPVVLVVDVRAMGASAAALIEGFIRHREDVRVVAAILNRVGGPDHEHLLRQACEEHFATPILGCLPGAAALALPERHLGLVQAAEHPALESVLEHAADVVERCIDLGWLIRLARPPSVSPMGSSALPLPPLGQRIAVAADIAFAFAYHATLQGWRRQGAEISTFSPLADEAPPAGVDAVYLPGGYPELHAGRLAAATTFRDGLRRAAKGGATIFGECGGYMALGEALIDARGTRHPMAGLLPVTTSFAMPQRHLGYREIELLADTPLGPAGARLRGHEFHYASETARGGAPFARARDARGRELGEVGCRVGSIAGSFLHLVDRAVPGRAGSWQDRR